MLRSRLCRLVGSRAYTLISEQQKSVARTVLDINQSHVASSLTSSHDARISSANTRALVNRFLQAVFTQDIAKSLELLKRFRSMDKPLQISHGSSVYTCCLITLLNHVIDSPSMNMIQLRETLQEYSQGTTGECSHYMQAKLTEGSKNTEMSQVNTLIVVVILKALASVYGARGQRLSVLNLLAYVKEINKTRQIDPEDVLAVLKKRKLKVIREFNLVFGRKEDHNEVLDEGPSLEQAYLQKCLNQAKGKNQFLDLNGLCEFIQKARYKDFQDFKSGQGFQALQKRGAQDSVLKSTDNEALSDKEVEIAKVDFYYQKQLLLEEHSVAIHKHTTLYDKISQFEAVHKKWIRDWYKIGVSQVQNNTDLMSHHPILHAYFDPSFIVSFTLSHMFYATLPSPHVKMLNVAMRITRSLKGLIRHDKELAKTYGLGNVVFSETSLLDYTCHVINVLVEFLKVPESATFDDSESQPVFEFFHIQAEAKNKRFGALKVNEHMSEALRNYQLFFQAGSYDLPMVYPPKDWVRPQKGGFLTNPLDLVKSSDPKALGVYFSRAHETGQLSSVYQALNTIGSVPWTMNPYIIDVLNKIWDEDDISKKLFKAPLNVKKIHRTPLPPRPREEDFEDKKTFYTQYSAWKSQRDLSVQTYNDAVNLSINYNMSKQLANAYCGHTFYFPHTTDFRGRVYPEVSFLSYHGDDLARGLLMFGTGMRLGKTGYDWLVYQMANLFSKTKMDMQQAMLFVQHNKGNIRQSHDNPMRIDSWWLQADNPWQCLALCRELVQIWDFQGNVEDYISHIPVHQDGSCNGLQHYSALGGDVNAAKYVNVLPETERQDIYVTVLELVKKRIQKDSHPMSNMALHFLSRKLIKQTVMTTVYGVTQFGATHQIHRQIMQNIESSMNGIPGALGQFESEVNYMQLASYIAGQVLASISELFSGAKKIQAWLVENCHRCIQAFEKENAHYMKQEAGTQPTLNFFDEKRWRPMMWTSLSGFPVIQLYRKRGTKTVKTPLQKLTLQDDAKVAPIDKVKSRNAIAPNFIHSIDAMHLKMTSLACKEQNITFVGVHDSYWTHAASVSTLSKILREEFVRLHESEILENLRKDLGHVNRNSTQLVWVEKKRNGEFLAALSEIREKYRETKEEMLMGNEKTDETIKRGTKNIFEKKGVAPPKLQKWNFCLNIEIMDNSHVEQLVQSYQPELLVRVPGPRHTVVYSNDSVPRPADPKISYTTHVPLLVPVKILNAPEVGSLDIEEVLESTYFFS